jgi:hypothetical protein
MRQVPRMLAAVRTGPVLMSLVLAACAAPDLPRPPDIPVALYGRNATIADAWFAVQPMRDPPLSVGFGSDIGVACWSVPAGSQVVMLAGPLGQGPTVATRVIATVDGPQVPDGRNLWVDVAADGSVSTGNGTPQWWSGASPC